ncbi:hypothetical protein E2C01_051435 [Portunus trituberculatus]|uniref:Uncharacterized protein n=1 Tax=Portunus trituberculatus TaxID=210409 RepID=A0A5B7GJ68_PORTR|nr:hypothetical protein [Portunus trituberculatus]
MGPLCFLILINDALTNTPDYSALQTMLNSLQEWSAESKMTINHTKTVVMHVCTSSTVVPLPALPGSSSPSKSFGQPRYSGSQ